jgi:hypothetical protein
MKETFGHEDLGKTEIKSHGFEKIPHLITPHG